MNKHEFKENEVWAHRVPKAAGRPAAKLALVFLPSRKGAVRVKVRHLEGELAGMEEFVPASQLLCRWQDWPKIEKDEQKELAFYKSVEGREELDPVVGQAATAVLLSSGEDLLVDDYRSYSTMSKDQTAGMDRVAERAGLMDKPWRSWPCYTNRHKTTYLPNDLLVDLAVAFAKTEPQTVNLHLDLEEAKFIQKGYRDSPLWHRDLLKALPAHAIARQWSSGEGRDYLRDELERVRRLAQEACYHLKEAGQDRKAASLLRQLDGS